MMLSIHAIGWTLVHFVWQGALVGLAAAVVLRLLRSASPQTRYLVACSGLAMMLASPVLTHLLFRTDLADSLGGPSPRISFDAAGTLPPFTVAAPPPFSGSVRMLHRGIEAFLPLIVGAWLIGVAVLVLRLAGGWWRVRRLHRRSLAIASSRWEAVSDRIRGRLAVRRRVHVVDSDLVETPTAIGWIRPVVLLPIATFAQLTPAQVEAILAHELAHIRRHD